MQGKFKYHINVGALSKEQTSFKTSFKTIYVTTIIFQTNGKTIINHLKKRRLIIFTPRRQLHHFNRYKPIQIRGRQKCTSPYFRFEKMNLSPNPDLLFYYKNRSQSRFFIWDWNQNWRLLIQALETFLGEGTVWTWNCKFHHCIRFRLRKSQENCVQKIKKLKSFWAVPVLNSGS